MNTARWGSSTASFYVNDSPVINDYDGQTGDSFLAGEPDIIKVDFVYAGIRDQIGYIMSLNSDYSSSINWYYDSYGTNALIPNQMIPSPTGGYLYPIIQQQQISFLNSESFRKDMRWIALTN